MIHLPLIQPNPPRLSTMGEALRAIETRQIYSNGGPVVRQFERDATDRLFGGRGACLAVSNATSGLMLALRHGIGDRANRGFFACVPALTFAATAQAAVWAGIIEYLRLPRWRPPRPRFRAARLTVTHTPVTVPARELRFATLRPLGKTATPFGLTRRVDETI